MGEILLIIYHRISLMGGTLIINLLLLHINKQNLYELKRHI